METKGKSIHCLKKNMLLNTEVKRGFSPSPCDSVRQSHTQPSCIVMQLQRHRSMYILQPIFCFNPPLTVSFLYYISSIVCVVLFFFSYKQAINYNMQKRVCVTYPKYLFLRYLFLL